MRILDRYILSRFLLNFASSFAILLFIFIFQAIWLFVDEWAGKDLDLSVMAKFLWNLIPTLLDKVILFTVLLSSILTFGNFAENYEFAAMKASGISLMRSMRAPTIFSILLGFGTFLLANYVTPRAEQQIFNMRTNLKDIKPASVIIEGVFSDIEGSNMNMMVSEKYGENDSKLKDIIIHQKSGVGQNTTVIRAQTGELLGGDDSGLVQLILNDGYYYEEVQPKKATERRKHPFAKAYFKTYIKNIDLSSLTQRNIDDDRGIVTDKMKSVQRLYKDIDSLKIANVEQIQAFSRNSNLRLGAFPLKNAQGKDSIISTARKQNESRSQVLQGNTQNIPDRARSTNTGGAMADTTAAPRIEEPISSRIQLDSSLVADRTQTAVPELASEADMDWLINSLPYWRQEQVYRNTENNIVSLVNTVRAKAKNLKVQRERYSRHLLSLHKKFALAFSCIILFFIGAPLGAIIKKGGIGFPMVIAFLLFIVYYFLGVAAENFAKKGNMEPVLGAWLSTLVMLPLSIVLTRRANRDKQFAGINTGFSGLFQKLKLRKAPEQAAEVETGFPGPETLLSIELTAEDHQQLDGLSDPELKEYALDVYRDTQKWDTALPALKILQDRSADIKDLRKQYLRARSEYKRYELLNKRFKSQNRVLLVTYVIALGAYIVNLLSGEGTQSAIYLFVGMFSLVLYLIYFLRLRNTLNEVRFAKVDAIRPIPVYWLILAFLAYPVMYLPIVKKLKTYTKT